MTPPIGDVLTATLASELHSLATVAATPFLVALGTIAGALALVAVVSRLSAARRSRPLRPAGAAA